MSEPTCMYKVGPFGKTISQIFSHPEDVPEDEGWVDSPAKVKPAKKPAAKRKAPAKKASSTT